MFNDSMITRSLIHMPQNTLQMELPPFYKWKLKVMHKTFLQVARNTMNRAGDTFISIIGNLEG